MSNASVAGRPSERASGRSAGLSSLGPFLIVGIVICFVAQVILWLRVAGTGLLVWPFVWAYSQAALLEGMIGTAGRAVYGLVWGAVYLGVSVLLWVILERSRVQHRNIWMRSAAAWFLVQLILAAVSWLLASRGVIAME